MANDLNLDDAAQAWRWLRWLGSACVVLLVVMIVGPAREVIAAGDRSWQALMVDLEWRPAVDVAVFFSAVGSVWVTLPARLIVAVWLAVRRNWSWLIVWTWSIAVSEVAIGTLKAAYGRARPPAGLEITTSASFPSGHAVVGAVTAVVVVAMVTHNRQRRWHWWVAAIVFSAAMALSRTYLRVHWLSDVIAGTLIGATVGLACLALVGVAFQRRGGKEDGDVPSRAGEERSPARSRTEG